MTTADYVTIAGLIMTSQVVGYVWGRMEKTTSDFLKEMTK